MGRLKGVVLSGPYLFESGVWTVLFRGKTCYVISQREQRILDKGVRTAREETREGEQLGHGKGGRNARVSCFRRPQMHDMAYLRSTEGTHVQNFVDAIVFTNLKSSRQLNFYKNTSLSSACANHNLYIMFLSVPESCTGRCRDWSVHRCLTPASANRIKVGVGCLIQPQQSSHHEFPLCCL